METKKLFNVYLYFPASELEIHVEADSIEDAVTKANERQGGTLLAKDVLWNDSTGKPVRVLGILEQGDLK